MMNKQFICSTDIGNPVRGTKKHAYLLYDQLRQSLTRDIGEEYARFLAQPVYDAKQDNNIDWYAEVEGDVRLFDELSDTEQVKYIGRIDEIVKKLRALADQYLKSNEAAKKDLGYALNAAVSLEPASKYRYSVGDQPIIVYWGFLQESPDYEGYLKRYLEVSLPKVEEPKIEESRVQETQNTQSDKTVREPGLPLLIFAGRVLWGTISLFVVLNIAYISWQLWRGNPLFDNNIFQGRNSENSDLIKAIKEAGDEGDSLQLRLNSATSQLKDLECDCDDKLPPGKVNGDIKDPGPEFEDMFELCDVGLLEGEWTAITKLKNLQTKKPITYDYTFDENGAGALKIVEQNGEVCKGEVTAKFNDKCDSLTINTSPVYCDENRYYEKTVTSCEINESKKAVCVIKPENGEPVQAEFLWKANQ